MHKTGDETWINACVPETALKSSKYLATGEPKLKKFDKARQKSR